MTIEERTYQSDDVNHAMNHGIERVPIHCAPTGSGKTVIQALIAKREMDRGDDTAILTPRNEIFEQTHSMLNQVCGYNNVATLRAKREGEWWDSSKPVHVCSWHTMISRARRTDFFFPKVRRVLVDECHLSMAPKILQILEHYKGNAIVDGYTATPARMTGRGLGQFFSEIKHVTTVRQLIKDGYLAPVEYWGGATPDLHGIKIRRGDYETKKLSDACVTLVGDAVDNWLRLASDRHTIVFAVDIPHCEMLAHKFQQVGIKAASLHVRKTDEQRSEIVEQFKAEQIQVLVNVSIASYGFDAPSVNCIQVCRPTKSIVLHLQMIGRGMRPKSDGSECMVLDHAGNVRDLGQADDLFRWRLDEGKKACENWSKLEASGEEEEAKVNECEQCHHLFSRSRVCPKCGWEMPFTKRDVATTEADLVLIGKSLVKRLPEGWPSHEVFFQMLIHHAQRTNKKPGWVFHTFKKKAGAGAPGHWINMAGVPPDKRIKNYIISRGIAYAAKQKSLRAADKT